MGSSTSGVASALDSVQLAAAAAAQERERKEREKKRAVKTERKSKAKSTAAAMPTAQPGVPEFVPPPPPQQQASDASSISDAADGVWPPRFDSAHPPVALPFLKARGDTYSKDETLARPQRLRSRSASTGSAGSSVSRRRRLSSAEDVGPMLAADPTKLASASRAAGVMPNPDLTRDADALLDAAQAQAGHLFLPSSSHAVPEDELMLLQLPTRLPLASALRQGADKYSFDASIPPQAADMPEGEGGEGDGASQAARLAEARGFAARRMDPHSLRDAWKGVPAGRVGTLRVHASGRVSMLLGEVELDITAGTHTRHLQEAVAIALRTEEEDEEEGDEAAVTGGASKKAVRVGDFVQLGQVQRKLIAAPRMEGLLPLWAKAVGMGKAAIDGVRGPQPAEAPADLGMQPVVAGEHSETASSALLGGTGVDTKPDISGEEGAEDHSWMDTPLLDEDGDATLASV